MIQYMFQVSSSESDEMGMLVLLSFVGLGIFLLVLALAFLASKLAREHYSQEDMEGIIDGEDEHCIEHFDSIENEIAIFIIGDKDTVGIVNPKISSETIQQSEEKDEKIFSTTNERTKFGKIVNTMKLLKFTNSLINGLK